MSDTHNADYGDAVIVCVQGCCAGCQDCYGMSIGCHQEPCRCLLSCTCRWKDEDDDPNWRDGCERHDTAHDQRRYAKAEDDWFDDEDVRQAPCPECGSTGACGYDDMGRPLIHAIFDPEERPAWAQDADPDTGSNDG